MPLSRRIAKLAIYLFPLGGIILSPLIAKLIIRIHWSMTLAQAPTLLGPKLTFLSVLTALGLFQYRYFYDEMLDLSKKAQTGDFGPGWMDFIRELRDVRSALAEHQRQLAETQQALENHRQTGSPHATVVSTLQQYEEAARTLAEREQALRQRHEEMLRIMSQVQNAFAAAMNESLPAFGFRLALIFLVMVLIAISVVVDLLSIHYPNISGGFITIWGQTSFLLGVACFVILIFYFVLIVGQQFSSFGQVADDLMRRDQST